MIKVNENIRNGYPDLFRTTPLTKILIPDSMSEAISISSSLAFLLMASLNVVKEWRYIKLVSLSILVIVFVLVFKSFSIFNITAEVSWPKVSLNMNKEKKWLWI